MTKGRLNEEVLHTVDGSEIRRSPVDVVDIPFIYRVFFTIQTVVGLGMSKTHQFSWLDVGSLGSWDPLHQFVDHRRTVV